MLSPSLIRGFAEFVSGPASMLIAHWPELAALAPVRSFGLDPSPVVDAKRLGRLSLADQVIGFQGGDIKIDRLRALGDAGVFRNVKYIDVGITRIQVIDPFEVFDYFAASQCAPNLCELRVSISHQDQYKRISQGPGKVCWNANNYFDYYGEGLDPAGVAAAMSISLKTVYSKKHKIRASLKRHLAEAVASSPIADLLAPPAMAMAA